MRAHYATLGGTLVADITAQLEGVAYADANQDQLQAAHQKVVDAAAMKNIVDSGLQDKFPAVNGGVNGDAAAIQAVLEKAETSGAAVQERDALTVQLNLLPGHAEAATADDRQQAVNRAAALSNVLTAANLNDNKINQMSNANMKTLLRKLIQAQSTVAVPAAQ